MSGSFFKSVIMMQTIKPSNLARICTKSNLPERIFEKLSENLLIDIMDSVDNFAQRTTAPSLKNLDTNLSYGVLTLRLNEKECYILNKQRPNRQIWLSSPISGPSRFDFVENRWRSLRDNQFLIDILKNEFEQFAKEEAYEFNQIKEKST
ncbi:MAG: Mitochondrial matrix iron chaperone [Paramarteilia canceri]